MLHLSLYLEDAADSLDDIQSIFSSIESFARAILKAKSAQETPAKMPPLKLQLVWDPSTDEPSGQGLYTHGIVFASIAFAVANTACPGFCTPDTPIKKG